MQIGEKGNGHEDDVKNVNTQPSTPSREDALDALDILYHGNVVAIQYPENERYEEELGWLDTHKMILRQYIQGK